MTEYRYLDLLKSVLVNEPYVELEAQLLLSVLCSSRGLVLDLEDFQAVRNESDFLGQLLEAKQEGETVMLDSEEAGREARVDGRLRNFTEFSYTLVGKKRLDNLQRCVEDVLDRGVPGDLLEAGAWRGGCCILMRAVLEARDCRDRRVWVADSFAGLPHSSRKEDEAFPMDASLLPVLAVSVDEVKRNFKRFDLLDEQVRFLPGWFEESLPASDTGPLAVIRVDCDLYESTWTVLEELYPRLSDGGWVIIDDYGILPPCRQAVDEFRDQNGIDSELEWIDKHAVCWKR